MTTRNTPTDLRAADVRAAAQNKPPSCATTAQAAPSLPDAVESERPVFVDRETLIRAFYDEFIKGQRHLAPHAVQDMTRDQARRMADIALTVIRASR